ncbi:MAG: hypothetical protein V2A61_01590, partial [Calditrichota bacterium]
MNLRLMMLIAVPALGLPALAPAAGERINHIRVPSAFTGMPIEVLASIEGGSRFPVEAKIFYRADDQDVFLYTEMIIERRDLKGMIPGPSVRIPELEYYLEVELDEGSKISYPEGAPDLVQPLRIAIKPIDSGGKTSEGIVILSPEPGSRQLGSQTLVAVSFLQGVRNINPRDILIDIDGENVTRQAVIYDELLTLTLKDLKPGRHYITINLIKAGKKEKLAGWGFAQITETYKSSFQMPVHGSVTTGFNHEDISEKTRDIKYLD